MKVFLGFVVLISIGLFAGCASSETGGGEGGSNGTAGGGQGGEGGGGAGQGGTGQGGSGGQGGTGQGGGGGAGGAGQGGGGGAGGAGQGGSGGAGGAGDFCYSPASSLPFNRACSITTDCELKFHMIDCCGSLAAVGINDSDAAAFDAAEATCQSICDCIPMLTVADDGKTSNDPKAFQVSCVAGMCKTSVP